MQPFLQKLAAYLFTHYPTKVSELCIVLPNKRAKIFLHHYLSQEFGKPIWAPAIYSIEDFISGTYLSFIGSLVITAIS